MSIVRHDPIGVCQDCIMIIANDDASGMDDETEQDVRANIARLSQGGHELIADGDELGFHADACDCCGALPGDRFLAYRVLHAYKEAA